MDFCGLLQCNTDLIGNKLFTPAELEPAILVLRPNGSFEYGGSRITVTCVAFGSPTPSVIWGSPTLGIANLQHLMDTSDMINIYTEEINNTYGDALVFSTLEICDLSPSTNNMELVCTASNGIATNTFGDENASVFLDPYGEVLSCILACIQFAYSFSIFVGKVKRNVNYPKSLPSLESMCL